MSDLISREYMKSLGATCIASRSKDGTLFPIVSIDELPPADLTHPTPSNTLGALDCVSRQAAIEAIESLVWYHQNRNKDMVSGANSREDQPWYKSQDVYDALEKLPSAQPERLTDDDFETIRIHLNAYKETLCNQHRWEEAEVYQRIIDRFMAFASTQPRKGKWTRHFDGNEWYWYCSSCKEQWYEEDLWMGGNSFPNFCPNCGCRMEEGDAE